MKHILFLLLLLIIPSVAAAEYHTTLLTVSEEKWVGGVADMYLEIRPGSGNIFMDSFPITRTDTQFSTRFANEVACDFLRARCDRFDFFYTIRAESTIVGGPSAGAAIAVLTVAALDGQKIRQDVAMTGTINSGGVVGPVAGIIPKANAAKKAGITTVVIPALATLGLDRRNKTNASINTSFAYDETVLENLSDDSFRVVRAGDLYDALPYFIDKEYPPPAVLLEVPASYETIMRSVSEVLCERRDGLVKKTFAEKDNRSQEISENVLRAQEEGAFYSAASYCFTQNLELQQKSLEQLRPAALRARMKNIGRELFVLDTFLQQENLTTLSDVETLAIVRERTVDAMERLEELNTSNISTRDLAYVIERTFSARVWSDFFAMESRKYVVGQENLRTGCLQKISEAEERVTYIEGVLPATMTSNSREELQLARNDLDTEEYALCLFKASKAKARANVLASVWAVTEDRVGLLIEQKLAAVERVLARQAEFGSFPIMGYSYYEYAQNLAEDQPYSALTFAEYALELSNLQMYFPEEQSWWEPVVYGTDWEHFGVFLIGLLTGLLVFWAVKK